MFWDGSNRKRGSHGRLGSLGLMAVVATLGCGPTDDGKDDPERYQPLVLGASWTYRVTESDQDTAKEKTQTVSRVTSLAGVNGDVWVLVTEQDDGDRTVSFQQVSGGAIVRYREESYKPEGLESAEVYTPSRLRLPDLKEVGASTTDSFRQSVFDASDVLIKESNKSETWTLEAIEPLSLPAGFFERTLRFRRVSAKSQKTFWFVLGVGKVREQSPNQLEELVRYELP